MRIFTEIGWINRAKLWKFDEVMCLIFILILKQSEDLHVQLNLKYSNFKIILNSFG